MSHEEFSFLVVEDLDLRDVLLEHDVGQVQITHLFIAGCIVLHRNDKAEDFGVSQFDSLDDQVHLLNRWHEHRTKRN